MQHALLTEWGLLKLVVSLEMSRCATINPALKFGKMLAETDVVIVAYVSRRTSERWAARSHPAGARMCVSVLISGSAGGSPSAGVVRPPGELSGRAQRGAGG